MTTKKAVKENEVRFVGGHHDGETMVIDPKQDKIELEYVEVVDQRFQEEHEETDSWSYWPAGANPPVRSVPARWVNGGSKTGTETYFRNPQDSVEFLHDDGHDPRLIGYRFKELARRVECLDSRCLHLQKAVGPGFFGKDLTTAVKMIARGKKTKWRHCGEFDGM